MDSPAVIDVENARRLARRHGHVLHYCVSLKRWFIWDRTRWREDNASEIWHIARKVVRGIYRQASLESDNNARRSLARHALESEHRIGAMIENTLSQPGISVDLNGFDADPWLLNVMNGTIDLRRMRILPRRKCNMITKLAPVVFDETAKCPRWHEFLDTIFLAKVGLIDYIKRMIGMSLTGDITEGVFFILQGAAGTGRATFINVLSRMMGDYWVDVPAEAFLKHPHGCSSTSYLAALRGVRLVTSFESEEVRKLKEPLLREMTQGELIRARLSDHQFFSLQTRAKVFIVSNYGPDISEAPAIWERIRLIPFSARIPEEQRTDGCFGELVEELPGILNWALEGCLAWQEGGLGFPEEVRAATDAYRKEMDMVGRFLDEACSVDPGGEVAVPQLDCAYFNWCLTNRRRGEWLGKRSFARNMIVRGFRQRADEDCRYWTGLRLNDFYNGFDDGSLYRDTAGIE